MIKGTTWILFIVLNLLFISLSTRVVCDYVVEGT